MNPAQINLKIPPKLYELVAAAAKKQGVPVTTYVRCLFEAAWAARHGATGDVDLDTSVARLMLLASADFDTVDAARFTGLSEATVVRVWSAWREEVGLPARATP